MGRIVRRTLVAASIVALVCVAVAGQQRETTNNERARRVEPTANPVAQKAGEKVDESFELNIAERRITEHDFFASTAIETGADAAHGLSLRIGVAVGASEIDVLLRNVQGRVRFRGSLDALRRVLDARRETNATPPQKSVP
jgi:hypothetical protein